MTIAQLAQNPGPGRFVLILNSAQVGKFEFPLAGLFIDLHENGYLDGAGLRKEIVFIEAELLVIGQVEHGETQDTAGAVGDFTQAGLSLLLKQF